MKKSLVIGIYGTLAAGLAFAAFAQAPSAQNEIATAHAHALMAQNAKTLDETHAHLHHVINCLVGPGGKGFDAAAGEPCKGQGNGALPDSAADHAMHDKLKNALGMARTALHANTLATAQGDAGKVATALQSVDASASKAGSQ